MGVPVRDVLLGHIVLVMACLPVYGKDLGRRDAKVWEVVDWRAEADEYSGNPFDVVATATFTHKESGEKRKTEMFYDGGNTWKFRFVGTRVGQWTFKTASDVAGLGGFIGSVRVAENHDPKIKGFVTSVGNKFAVQFKDETDVRAYIFTVYMSRVKHPAYLDEFPSDLDDVRKKTQAYFADAMANGFEIIFIHVNNNWFKHGVREHDKHGSVNPDPVTFRVLEEIITTVHKLGGRVHIWAWGDESRKWTPRGVPGGVNGEADRRLQRYIAARLGPLPGWTLAYGFDLHEWTNTEQLNSWAKYMHKHFGWQHLLCARGHILEGTHNMNSYDGFGRDVPLKTTSHGPKDCAEILEDLASDKTRPHFYEERHSYKRSGFSLDMDGTRRLLWWETMAGGMGGFFGFYPTSPHPYPNPEQLRTHYEFWHTKRRFELGMKPVNELTEGGRALGNFSTGRYVFYKEDTDTIRMNLKSLSGRRNAIAVDTKKAYKEIDLGMLDAKGRDWKAPYKSDWAIAVGSGD